MRAGPRGGRDSGRGSAVLQSVDVAGVEVLHWNPRTPLPLRPRRAFRWTRHLPLAPRVDNVGDLLGPEVVRQQVRARGLRAADGSSVAPLGAVGSVLHMLPPGAVVWGAGVNGKHRDLELPADLDLRAVRGPLTGRYLTENGRTDPGVYGDPALLLDLGPLRGRGAPGPAAPGERSGVLWIDNLNERRPGVPPPGVRSRSPRERIATLIEAIDRSELVIGSSLHALVLAEVLGVPARGILSEAEPPLKYLDYYEGSGRAGVRLAHDVEEALSLGGVPRGPTIDPALRESFPADLWRR
ncbi:polysaccharide pyruvyl transferase family protein [Brachybacterium sp. YJGR34]|uniref:polysaccharide pyruvyl transferase family protein n=1 Tax=Brachybacterium sp. YJGR34 TaxID=2059911 RepID=UPI0018E60921|nr:polysaccharide pyruvyl transferase family protein [Brachybacterium sp. YJGR34]